MTLKLKWLLSINIFMLLFVSIYIIRGEDSYISMGDGMDGPLVSFKVIADNNAHFWSNDKMVDGLIGNQPRSVYPSGFNITLWLYTFFNPITAYLVNFILIHFVALFGMFFLLIKLSTKYNLFDGENNFKLAIISFSSLAFAVKDSWPYAGIFSAGLPLLLLGFLFIEEKKYIWGYLLFFIYAIYSSLILSGIFVLIIYSVYICYKIIKKKNLRKLQFHIAGFIILIVLYAIIEYRLILLTFFNESFIPHREGFAKEYNVTVFQSFFRIFYHMVLFNQQHVGQIFPIFNIFALFISIFIVIKKRKYKVSSLLILVSKFYLVLVIVVLILSNVFAKVILSLLPFIKMIQWDRFYVFSPTLTILIFTFFLLQYAHKINKNIVILFFLPAILWGFATDINWQGYIKPLFNKIPVSYKSFYKEELFLKVKETLEINNYRRVVALGYHPSINVFNGIKSADGYLNLYSLKNKNNMFEVISKELELNKSLEKYFINWGSRCYFFNSDFPMGNLYHKKKEFSFNRKLMYDYDKALEYGISHIISIYPVDINLNDRLELQNTITFQDNYYIYIYKIKIN